MKILQRFIAVFLNLFFTTPPSRTFPLFQASLAINKLLKIFFFFLINSLIKFSMFYSAEGLAPPGYESMIYWLNFIQKNKKLSLQKIWLKS